MAVIERAPTLEQGRMAARWSRLAALGLLLAGVAPLLMLGAGVVSGMDFGDDGMFFVIPAGVALLGSALVWRLGLIGRIAGIIASVLVGMALWWTVFGLTTPNSFFDFVPGLLVIPGVITALASSIAAIVAGRRDRETKEATGAEAKAIRIVIGLVAVLALVSGVLTLASRSSVEATGAPAVEAKNFKFGDAVTVAGGGELVARNADPFLHTVTVDELGIDVSLSPGQEVLVDVPSRPGTYVLYCKPHTGDPKDPSEDDMATQLVVT